MRKGRDGGNGKKKKTDENSGHYVVCQQSTARTTTAGTPVRLCQYENMMKSHTFIVNSIVFYLIVLKYINIVVVHFTHWS